MAPVSIRKSAYSGVRMAQGIRWNVPSDYKKIFDLEGDAAWWDAPISLKTKRLGISKLEYTRALEAFSRMPVVRLAILLLRCENDFLENWWVNLKDAEKLAHEMKNEKFRYERDKDGNITHTIDLRPQAIKALLMVEREKMMGIKRLVETGRMIDPHEYSKEKVRRKPKPYKPFISEDGILDVEKIP